MSDRLNFTSVDVNTLKPSGTYYTNGWSDKISLIARGSNGLLGCHYISDSLGLPLSRWPTSPPYRPTTLQHFKIDTCHSLSYSSKSNMYYLLASANGAHVLVTLFLEANVNPIDLINILNLGVSQNDTLPIGLGLNPNQDTAFVLFRKLRDDGAPSLVYQVL